MFNAYVFFIIAETYACVLLHLMVKDNQKNLSLPAEVRFKAKEIYASDITTNFVYGRIETRT